MNEKRGYKPLRKNLAYMKRMINTGKWKANNRIPTLARIADTTKTSVGTVMKAVKILEAQRLLDNQGSLGYCVIPPELTDLYTKNKNSYYLQMVKTNLDAMELLHQGGRPLGKFIVKNADGILRVINVISGDTIETSITELRDSMDNPVTLNSMMALKGGALASRRRKYFKQQKLREIAKIMLKNKELL